MKVGVHCYRWDYYAYTRTILHQVPGELQPPGLVIHGLSMETKK